MVECSIFVAEVQLTMAIRWRKKNLYAVPYRVFRRAKKSEWQLVLFA
jgi:hypothetical protein